MNCPGVASVTKMPASVAMDVTGTCTAAAVSGGKAPLHYCYTQESDTSKQLLHSADVYHHSSLFEL